MNEETPIVETLIRGGGDGTGALGELRAAGAHAFAAAGVPTRRQEAWKYTGLTALGKHAFGTADATPDDAAVANAAGALEIDVFRLVLVNGRFRADLSDLEGLPADVFAGGLSDALAGATGEQLAALIGRGVTLEHMPMAALNTAHLGDGAVVHVPAGVSVEKPFHIVMVTAGASDGEATAAHPRVLVVLDENAQATVIEGHVGLGGGTTLNNGVAEIFVGRGAHLGHYKWQGEDAGAFHVWATAVHCAGRSVYDGFVLQTGQGLARNEVRVTLDGERIEANVNGAYVGAGDAHIDNTTFIDHARPNSVSRETYKGVLADGARGVFQGKILVRPDAQGTDGHQLNRALLLSRSAEIDSKPELEIYADDVKCSHGATAGELDETELFYLRSRGIDEETARAILVKAFLAEALEKIGREPVREAFTRIVEDRLDRAIAGKDAGRASR